MKIGYARTSTLEQEAGLEAQIRDLKAAGCEKLFHEQASSAATRAKLEAALDYLREGDTLVVTKLDRLARSVLHLGEVVAAIERKGAQLRILTMGLDTATATGRLMLNVIGSVAQFEREMMLERQREGIAKAKAEGKYRGRPRAPKPPRSRRFGNRTLARVRSLGGSASIVRASIGCWGPERLGRRHLPGKARAARAHRPCHR
jgi:DNA invertase Pin-like site-specific DNA recombinase